MSRQLELRHLRAVLATMQAGSLHRAAQMLATSQPALSRLLREAEERTGLILFERTAKGSVATRSGGMVAQVAQRVMGDMQQLELLQQGLGWRVRVGCIPRAVATVMPRLLQLPPEIGDLVQIDLQEDASPALMSMLGQGRLDIAILSLTGSWPGSDWYSRVLYTDHNVFVAGAGSICAAGKSLGPAELARHRFVAPAPGTPSRGEFDQYWLQHDLAPPVCRMTARTYDTIASVLPGTDLLSVMPRQVAERHAQAGTLSVLDVTSALPLRPVHVIWSCHAVQPVTDQIIGVLFASRLELSSPC